MWVRARLVTELTGHRTAIDQLLMMNDVLLSIDSENELMLWDAANFVPLRETPLKLGNAGSRITCVLHPLTYVNKVLVGSDSGKLYLWNFRTDKLLYTFQGWGSPVTCSAQSPALDVVAIGLADGRVMVVNLKTDSVVMTLKHANSSVTSLAFRFDVNLAQSPPTLVSGDSSGVIVVWDLQKQIMVSMIRDAHRFGAVSSLTFLLAEPVLISSGGADNSLKMWIFDSENGSARVLRERSGHSAPPRHLLFLEQNSLVSGGGDGAVRVISVIQDQRSREYSQKKLKKATRKKLTRLPPVVAMSFCPTRAKEWPSLVTAHAGLDSLWGWRNDALVRGSHFPSDPSALRACAITHCGNYSLVGTSAGGLHKINLQSGRIAGSVPKAHAGPVEGVATDIGETVCITCSLDGFIRFWDLNNLSLLLHEINVGTPLATMEIHREGGLFMVSGDDWTIRVYDIESRSLAREFRGHTNNITALAFSGNCKWVVSASADASIRTWDIVSSHCIDGFLCPKPAVALAFSPNNDMLATAHSDDVGVFLWSNRAHFTQIYLRPFDADRMAQMALPSVHAEANDFFVAPRDPVDDEETLNEIASATGGATWAFLRELPQHAQDARLLAQSGDPETKFLSLVHVDEAKERNKPVMPPTLGPRAPFALPTVSTLEGPQFIAAPTAEEASKSRILEPGVMSTADGSLSKMLRQGGASGAWEPLAKRLREGGPSSVDLDIRLLSLEKDYRELFLFIDFLLWMLECRHDFDLIQGYLYSFLNAHGDTLTSQASLKVALGRLHRMMTESWKQVNELLQRNSCYCNILR